MIKAEVVAHSKSMITGTELVSLEVVMPRFILAEFNTHRMFTRNSASSRAIPFKKMVQSIKTNMFYPYAWQKDHKGMQGNEYLSGWRVTIANIIWWLASRMVIMMATLLNMIGVTKQLANRLLEPFMYHKVLVTATEWQNFFELRCPQYEYNIVQNHKGNPIYKSKQEFRDNTKLGISDDHEYWKLCNKGMAEIHMMILAKAIYEAIRNSKPKELMDGEWHIPYDGNIDEEELKRVATEYKLFAHQLRLVISVARCARTSYTTAEATLKDSYVADLNLYNRLYKSKHLSPFEHVAEVMGDDELFCFPKGELGYTAYEPNDAQYDPDEDDGISKVRYYPIEGDKVVNKYGWCYNFHGFKQVRWYLENNQPFF